jgi:hypothetical protein
MKKHFFASARYKMAVPEGIRGIDGGLIFPAGISAHTLVRRDLEKQYPYLARRLLDPQIYLSQLPAHTCRNACVNLASYGWFQTGSLKSYDSSVQTQTKWKDEALATIYKNWSGKLPETDEDISAAVEKCVLLQTQIGCEAIILPAPLTNDLGSDFSTEARWMDIGIKISRTLAPDKPHLVSIALNDSAIRGMEPYKNDLLTVIIDQVTARSPNGAYLVIEQSNESANSYYCNHPNTIGSLLRLAYELKQGGLERIVVGPVGIAGYLATAVAADIWSVGYYRSARRMRLTDFEDQEGRSFPTYYSHPLGSEFHLENDLDRASEAGFLSQLADQTEASKGLLRALSSKQKVGSVVDWQYRSANVAAASEHFLAVAARETQKLASLSASECLKSAHQWLKTAEQLSSDLTKLGGFQARTELRHQASWLKAFEDFLKSSSLG